MTHCLVVDDSRVIRTVARRIFEELHYSAVEAEDGMTALRLCGEKMPDLILLDWSMPGMSGVDLVRALRALTDGAKPIILIATTEMNSSDIVPGITAGADDYLVKPIDREILAAKLAELRFPRTASQAKAAG